MTAVSELLARQIALAGHNEDATLDVSYSRLAGTLPEVPCPPPSVTARTHSRWCNSGGLCRSVIFGT